jgi:hypothetical protein
MPTIRPPHTKSTLKDVIKITSGCQSGIDNLSSGVRHEVAYVIVSSVCRKEEKPAVSSAVAYRRMRSWQRLGVKPPGQRNLLERAASAL